MHGYKNMENHLKNERTLRYIDFNAYQDIEEENISTSQSIRPPID
jgi:hypothetical protein